MSHVVSTSPSLIEYILVVVTASPPKPRVATMYVTAYVTTGREVVCVSVAFVYPSNTDTDYSLLVSGCAASLEEQERCVLRLIGHIRDIATVRDTIRESVLRVRRA